MNASDQDNTESSPENAEENDHSIAAKILGEFETSISETAKCIENTLLPSESWRLNEVDIRMNRFIRSCRDFVSIVNIRFGEKIRLPISLLKANTFAALEGTITYRESDDVRIESFGSHSKMSEDSHKEFAKVSSDTIRMLDKLSSFIRSNYNYLIHQPICEELCWVVICLKQARCMLRYTAIQDFGKDAEIFYAPKKIKEEMANGS